jgi:hypothetical protein
MGETAQEVKRGQSLFSPEERRAIVRSFIEQFLGGKVAIKYWNPSANVIDITSGKKASGAEKVESKISFLNLLEAACKADATTDRQSMQQAVDLLFDRLITFRSGGFIEGEFPVPSITESRLSTLETRVTSIEGLLEELKNILKVKGP